MKKPGRAFLWLLLIPMQALLDMGMIYLGIFLDTHLADTTQPGHPVPAMTILAFLAAIVISVLVFFISVIVTIVRYSQLKKKEDLA